jgi:acetolactate synthase-1/2/3 large subunit
MVQKPGERTSATAEGVNMKVSDYIASFLHETGVQYVYGCIGGAVTHIVDSIFRQKMIRYIHSYHEQAAAFSASAYAKYSGALGVAVATSGPGATNLITGIADAYFDSAPVLLITGQVNTYDFKYQRRVRQCGFQETDIVNIVKPITKYSFLLDKVDIVEDELEKAVGIAVSGRPGPVLLDIPMDIQRSEISPKTLCPRGIQAKENAQISKDYLELTFDAVCHAERPLILAGGGCRVSNARNELLSLAERFAIPVVVSLLGKDCFPNDHRLFAGFVGAYGNRYANLALAASDLLIVLGSRLDSRQVGNILSPFLEKEIIQVDLEPDPTDRRFPQKKMICAEVKNFITQFLCFAEGKKLYPKCNDGWIRLLSDLKRMFPPLDEPKRAMVESFHYNIMDEISRNLSPDDVICVDIGQNQMLAAQVLEIRGHQRFITSGGMAPMGYGLPASISIAIASNKRVILIAGDGGMQLNIHELNTVGKLRLPIIMFVLDNKSLGMIKQFQDLYFDSHYCDTDERSGYYTPNFASIAQAYGIEAWKINKSMAHWRQKIRKIFNYTKLPLLVHVEMDYPTYVYPKLEFDKPIDKPNPKLKPNEERMLANLGLNRA